MNYTINTPHCRYDYDTTIGGQPIRIFIQACFASLRGDIVDIYIAIETPDGDTIPITGTYLELCLRTKQYINAYLLNYRTYCPINI